MLPVIAALALTVATLLLALAGGWLRWLLGKPTRRYFAAAAWLHVALFALHLFVTFPALLGWLVSRHLPTRPDESSYVGPRFDDNGELVQQSRQSLRRERAGEVEVPAAVLTAARATRHEVPASIDGEGRYEPPLCLYRMPPRRESPRAVVLLVHGLFRSSVELEPVARMFRDRGCACWLLDQRNHGNSGRAPFTAGLRESDDVVRAVAYLRRQPGVAERPLVLFGVSLGTIAVSLALPRIDGVAGVVFDAPIDDVLAAAERVMQRRGFYQPWRSLLLTALGIWSDFDPAAVVPLEAVAGLPHDLPVLVVSEGLDDRATPATVRSFYERLPMHEGTKELWRVPGVRHGHAFVDRPVEYDRALGRLLDRLR